MNIPLLPTTLAAYCNPDDHAELETLHAIVRNWARQVAQKEAAAERERCAKLCDEWAQTCEWGRRHGAKVGSQECAKLIRMQEPAAVAPSAPQAPSKARRCEFCEQDVLQGTQCWNIGQSLDCERTAGVQPSDGGQKE